MIKRMVLALIGVVVGSTGVPASRERGVAEL